MEILHFKDLGDTECHLAANAVVLVPGEYSISKYRNELGVIWSISHKILTIITRSCIII